MAPVPATKLQELSNELNIPWLVPSEFRLHQILAELRSLKPKSPDEAYPHFLITGMAHNKGGNFAAALHAFECAARIRRDKDALTNLGFTLLWLGRVSEALSTWIEASVIENDRDPIILANLAEVFGALGREDDAWDMLREAIVVADPANVMHLFILANQAAELGAHEVAIDLFARFLAILSGKPIGDRSVVEFIDHERPANMNLDQCPALDATVRRTIAFGETLASMRRRDLPRVEDVGEDAMSLALEVFGSMRPTRARATVCGMSESPPA